MADDSFVRARLIPVDRASRKPLPAAAIEVHFNPETLKLTRSNTIKADPKGKGQKSDPAQHIDASSSKLSFDLVFDSTLEYDEAAGYKDVRETTGKLIRTFMDPPEAKADGGKTQKPPPAPLCVFSWGSFYFTGIVESINETIEFFSPNGVPLRAVLGIAMAEDKFDYTPEPVRQAARAMPEFVPVAPAAAAPDAVAAAGGTPTAWRDTALYNGLETPRFAAGAAIAVPGLAPEAPAGLGFSFGGSASLGTTIPGAFGGAAVGGTAALGLGRRSPQ